MMDVAKPALAALMIAAVTTAMAAPQDQLLPLSPTDIPQGCGCNFVRYKSKGEGPILHWATEGKKQAVVRTDKLHVLELRQEKYIRQHPDHPQPDDRMVLFVANGDWQIQVLGMQQPSTCGGKRQCNETDYRGRLLVQQEGGARTEIPVDGACGCPKP
jgi:hypothetical protein